MKTYDLIYLIENFLKSEKILCASYESTDKKVIVKIQKIFNKKFIILYVTNKNWYNYKIEGLIETFKKTFVEKDNNHIEMLNAFKIEKKFTIISTEYEK